MSRGCGSGCCSDKGWESRMSRKQGRLFDGDEEDGGEHDPKDSASKPATRSITKAGLSGIREPHH
jgi:hypothetical protein